MKKIIFFLSVVLIFSFTIVSCSSMEDKIIGKWQHVLIVGQSSQGNDTLDMTQYPPTYNVFREDGTLQIYNSQQEENVRYLIRDNKLYSFKLGKTDTAIMEIKKLTKDELILQVKFREDSQRIESLYYKKVK